MTAVELCPLAYAPGLNIYSGLVSSQNLLPSLPPSSSCPFTLVNPRDAPGMQAQPIEGERHRQPGVRLEFAGFVVVALGQRKVLGQAGTKLVHEAQVEAGLRVGQLGSVRVQLCGPMPVARGPPPVPRAIAQLQQCCYVALSAHPPGESSRGTQW